MKHQITIIIPFAKKSEVYLAEDALKSILLQPNVNTCKIIVSNNSAERVGKKIFKSKIYNNKINYIEPIKNFNMIEHFNWLIARVKTKYFMILAARRMLKFGALTEFIRVMNQNPDCQICCSSYSHWEEDLNCLISHNVGGKNGLISSKKIIKKFINGDYNNRQEFWSYLPTTMNGIVRTNFVNRLSKLYSKDFYEKIAPDCSAGFKCLFNTSKIYRIKKPLFQTSNRNNSNGFNFISKFDLSYFKKINLEKKLRFIPEELRWCSYSSVFEDFCIQSFNYYDYKKKFQNYDLNKFILKQSAIEIFFKTFNNFPSKERIVIFYKCIKCLFKNNLSFSSFVKSIFFSLSYFLYINSPILIKKILLKVRGNYYYYNNKYEAANFFKKINQKK